MQIIVMGTRARGRTSSGGVGGACGGGEGAWRCFFDRRRW